MRTQFSLEDRFERDPEMPFRVIEDEVVLVPVKRNVVEVENGIYLLRDKVAFRIWELIDGKKTVGEIRKKLLEEFQAEPSQLEEDLEEFLENLKQIGGIRRINKET